MRLTIGLLDLAAMALSWIALITRLTVLRLPGDPATRALLLLLALLGLAHTISLPAASLPLAQLTGISHLGWLTCAMLLLAAAWATRAFLACLRPEGSTRRVIVQRGLLLGLTCGLLVALFVLTARTSLGYPEFITQTPLLTGTLVYLAVLGMTLGELARGLWSYAGQTGQADLRLGLRLTAVGSVVGLGSLSAQAIALALDWLNRVDVLGGDGSAITMVSRAGTILILIGITIPTWLPSARCWLNHYRAYHRLLPLWRAVTGLTSSIALPPPPTRLVDALRLRNLDLHLLRRVVEIRTGQLLARACVDGHTVTTAQHTAHAAGLTGDVLAAYVEAATITAAHQRPSPQSPEAAPPPLPAPGGTDLCTEVTFLIKVTRALRSQRHLSWSSAATANIPQE